MSTTFSPASPVARLCIDTSCPSPSVVRVAVAGQIDLATVGELHDGLRPVLSAPLPRFIDVDLAGVTFMDCTGLSVLATARNAAVRNGRQLQVTNPQPIVRRILDLSGLLGVLTATFAIEPTPAAVPRLAVLPMAA